MTSSAPSGTEIPAVRPLALLSVTACAVSEVQVSVFLVLTLGISVSFAPASTWMGEVALSMVTPSSTMVTVLPVPIFTGTLPVPVRR